MLIGEDIYKYRPSQVAKEVADKSGKEFSTNLHAKAWRMYEPRPVAKHPDFKSEYAEFKQAENDYRYSQAWVDFLADKLRDYQEYQKLLEFKL